MGVFRKEVMFSLEVVEGGRCRGGFLDVVVCSYGWNKNIGIVFSLKGIDKDLV